MFMLLFSFLFQASAAPIPATSTSALIHAPAGIFRSPLGFSLHSGPTTWVQAAPPQQMQQLATLYKSPILNKGVQAALTVRVDQLKEDSTLKTYVKTWMKDYSRFGFDVLAAKPIRVEGQNGFLLDVLNRDAAKQLRQVVFLKDRVAVILTCRDHRDNFEKSLGSCNDIIRTFKWNDDKETPKVPQTKG